MSPNPSVDTRYPWKVLGIAMLGVLMAALDTSIVNVSLPAIMADFGASLDDIEWVITGYMLAFAAMIPATAWLRDRFGQKNLYIASLIVFTIGSLFCGLAWSLSSLIFARVLQAVGGGAIMPSAMTMITESFAPKDRARAMGIFGMGVLVGPSFGPTLGGWLTNAFGWRSIFLVNLPIGVIGVILAVIVLRYDRPHKDHRPAFDLWGFAFLTLFLVSFLLGVSKGEKEGWYSAYEVTCFLLSGAGLVGFLVVESIVPNGIVDLGLFRYPIFTAAMAVTVVRSIALFGGVFLLPIFLQQQKGLDEIESGLILLPGSLVVGAMMPLTSKLMERISPRILTIGGLLFVCLFMYLYRNLDVNTSLWGIIMPTVLRGIGIGLLFTPVTMTAMNHVPKAKIAMASSISNLVQQVGGSIGIAVLGTVLAHRIKFHLANLASTTTANTSAFFDSARRVAEQAHNLGYTHAQSAAIARSAVSQTVVSSASVSGFQDAFLFGTLMVGMGILAAFFLPDQSVKQEGPSPVAME